ncbi:hypothetical protein Tco_0950455 [Tanacetum coccineum]
MTEGEMLSGRAGVGGGSAQAVCVQGILWRMMVYCSDKIGMREEMGPLTDRELWECEYSVVTERGRDVLVTDVMWSRSDTGVEGGGGGQWGGGRGVCGRIQTQTRVCGGRGEVAKRWGKEGTGVNGLRGCKVTSSWRFDCHFVGCLDRGEPERGMYWGGTGIGGGKGECGGEAALLSTHLHDPMSGTGRI